MALKNCPGPGARAFKLSKPKLILCPLQDFSVVVFETVSCYITLAGLCIEPLASHVLGLTVCVPIPSFLAGLLINLIYR